MKPNAKLFVADERLDRAKSLDWSKAVRVKFPNLKPTSVAISLRLPHSMLDELKAAANRRDVPYQSMLKMIIADWLKSHRKAA